VKTEVNRTENYEQETFKSTNKPIDAKLKSNIIWRLDPQKVNKMLSYRRETALQGAL